jgi:hypothetical protein
MTGRDWIRYICVSAVAGVIIETAARVFGLWLFDPWWIFLPWAVLWEGVCFGTLAWLVRGRAPAVQFLVGVAAGGAGEVVSAWVAPFWVFPGERLLFVRGLPGIVIFLTLLWGVYCPLLNLVMKRLFRTGEA